MDGNMSIEDALAFEGIDDIGEAIPNRTDVDASAVKMPTFGSGEPSFATKMLKTIEEVDEYSWNRGELGGLDWGFDKFNEAFEGLNTGVHLVAGASNVGKSGIMMQMGWQIAQKNKEVTEDRPKKAFVIYFSLDDNNNELLPRLVAIDRQIPINSVRFPRKYEDNQHFMNQRKIGFQNLKESVMNIHMLDVNDGSDIEHIEETAEKYANELSQIDENYQIVIMIDNFHDVTVRDASGWDESKKYNHIADELSRIATKFDCPVICTAEFRKLNGSRRPVLDDIRESVKIVYEAKAIILCYNEVGLRGQQAGIYWEKPESDEKQPVFEAHIGKNKFGSFKGRAYFEFMPEMSYFREASEAGAIRYSQMVTG